MDPINPNNKPKPLNHQFIISWSTLFTWKIPAFFCMFLGMPRGSCHFSFVAGIMEGMSILRYIYIVANGYQLVSAHLVGIIVPSPPSNWSCTNTPVTFGEGTHFPLVAMIGEYGASFFVVWWCWYRQNTTKMLLLDAKNGFGLGLHRVKDVKLWNCCCFFFFRKESRLAFMFFSHAI